MFLKKNPENTDKYINIQKEKKKKNGYHEYKQ